MGERASLEDAIVAATGSHLSHFNLREVIIVRLSWFEGIRTLSRLQALYLAAHLAPSAHDLDWINFYRLGDVFGNLLLLPRQLSLKLHTSIFADIALRAVKVGTSSASL